MTMVNGPQVTSDHVSDEAWMDTRQYTRSYVLEQFLDGPTMHEYTLRAESYLDSLAHSDGSPRPPTLRECLITIRDRIRSKFVIFPIPSPTRSAPHAAGEEQEEDSIASFAGFFWIPDIDPAQLRLRHGGQIAASLRKKAMEITVDNADLISRSLGQSIAWVFMGFYRRDGTVSDRGGDNNDNIEKWDSPPAA